MRKKKKEFSGDPLVKDPSSSAGDSGSIPGEGTKIPHGKGQRSPRAATLKSTE